MPSYYFWFDGRVGERQRHAEQHDGHKRAHEAEQEEKMGRTRHAHSAQWPPQVKASHVDQFAEEGRAHHRRQEEQALLESGELFAQRVLAYQIELAEAHERERVGVEDQANEHDQPQLGAKREHVAQFDVLLVFTILLLLLLLMI